MGNIVPSPVSHKCNDFGYLQPLLTYLLNIMYIPGTLNKYFLVKKIISMILWGIRNGGNQQIMQIKICIFLEEMPRRVELFIMKITLLLGIGSKPQSTYIIIPFFYPVQQNLLWYVCLIFVTIKMLHITTAWSIIEKKTGHYGFDKNTCIEICAPFVWK